MDPGNEGCCSLLSLDATRLDWFKLPTKCEFPGTARKIVDALALKSLLEKYNIFTCAIERQAYKNMKLVQNYGICVGALDILEISMLKPTPISWMSELKKYLGLEHVKNKNKEFTFKAFEKVFPGIDLPNKDDNIADAALLAYYAYMMMQKAAEQ